MEKNDFIFDRPEDSTGFLLWQLTNLWQREIKKALEQYDLTHVQFVLLASIHWLTLAQQEITQVVLSQHTKIDPMTTSTVLRTLQHKGLVSRQEHTQDTRAKTVLLTALGTDMIKQAIVRIEAFDQIFFEPIAGESADFNQKLMRLLRQGYTQG